MRRGNSITSATGAQDHKDEFWTSYRLGVVVITSIIVFLLLFVMLIGYLCLRLIKVAQQNSRLERGKYTAFPGRDISAGGFTNAGQDIEMTERDMRMTLYQQTLNKYDSDPELTYIWRTTPRYPETQGYGATTDERQPATPPAIPPPPPPQTRVRVGVDDMPRWSPQEVLPPGGFQAQYPWTFPRGSVVNVVSGSSRQRVASRDDYLVIVVDDTVTRL